MTEPQLRLGTRGSALALAQAKQVAKALGGAEIVTIKTSDGAVGDKARFVKEIERALLDGEVDLGVHSAKDLPTDLPEDLEIAGVPTREDPRDSYVGPVNSLGECPEGSRIGTSSLRRRAQILALRPDLEVVELRGNVDTRLGKLESGEYDGLVLAAAGLHRLGRAEEMAFPIEPGELVPAAGQGAIAIEARHSQDRPAAAAESITDRGSLATLLAERAVVAALDATCNTPLGRHRRPPGGWTHQDSGLLRPAGRQRVDPRRDRGGRCRPGGGRPGPGGAAEVGRGREHSSSGPRRWRRA